MKSSTTDKVQSKMHQATGKIKETVGNLVGNRDLEAEGKREHSHGNFQEKIGQVKKVMGK